MFEKLSAKLKFQTEIQNDRSDKNNMPPDIPYRGHRTKGHLIYCMQSLVHS